MTRRTTTNRRPQSTNGREVSLQVRATQGRRFSNASGPHMSGERYDRSATRNAMQRGDFDYFDSI